MSTDLDTELLPEVLSLIDEIGVTVTFTLSSPVAQDTDKGSITGIPLSYSHKVSPPSIDDDGNKVVYLAGSGVLFTPEEGIKVAFSAYNTMIAKVKPIYSGDDVAAWKIVLAE
jgi:hypothetical protein